MMTTTTMMMKADDSNLEEESAFSSIWWRLAAGDQWSRARVVRSWALWPSSCKTINAPDSAVTTRLAACRPPAFQYQLSSVHTSPFRLRRLAENWPTAAGTGADITRRPTSSTQRQRLRHGISHLADCCTRSTSSNPAAAAAAAEPYKWTNDVTRY